MSQGAISFKGRLATRLIRARRPPLWWRIRNYLRWCFIKSLFGVFVVARIAKKFGLFVAYGKLSIVHIKANGERINYGAVSYRLVTTAFVTLMVDQLQAETSVWGDFKYHDSGVGTTPAATGDTDIETTDGEPRASGSQTESSATVYRSVGTISYTTTKAITEHGLFNASSGVTLMDRHVFTAINVVNGDSIQFTYDLTCTAGG